MNKEELKKISRAEKEKLFIDSEIILQKYWGNYINPKWGENFSFEWCDDDWIENKILSNQSIYQSEINNISLVKKYEYFFDKLFPYFWFVISMFILLWLIWLLLFWMKQLF